MRKISKIRLTVYLILACFAVGCIVFAGMGVKANASGTFEMKSGASVKVGTDNGLRFTAVLPASEYENGATYGMLIAPEDYVRTNDLTVENVFGENAVYDYAVRNEQGEWVYFGTKTRIINVTYDTLPTDENGDYLIKGSILSLKDNNIARNFVGRAYKRTGTEGSYVYEMANYTGGNVGNNARSMFAVAKAAINSDRESAATKAFLESEYIDKSYTLATLTEGDDYVKFFSKSSSENGSVIRDLAETTDVPEGYDKAYGMYAQYGDAYTLFAGVNLEEYIRLKFMIKGTYTVPGIGYFENTEWKEIKCKKNSDGVWSLTYNGTEVALQQKMTLSGSIYITDLYGVKEDASAKYYRVTYKNENNEILGYKSIKSGNSAALTPDDKDLGDGYTLTYDNVKWLDSIGGSEVDLSSVTEDKTVYLSATTITYKSYDENSKLGGNADNLINIAYASANKYLSVTNNKLEMVVRPGENDMLLALMTLTDWESPLGMYTVKGAWYRFVLEFDGNGIGTSGNIYDTSGNSVKSITSAEAAKYNTTTGIWLTVSMPVISWEPLTRGTIASADVGYISQTGNVKNYTVTYMDENGNVIGTKKVNEGGGATFVPTATTTDDGYTIEYKNVVWLDSVGGDEVDLSSVTKNMTVYLSSDKYIVKSYEYNRQDNNGGGLINSPSDIHKFIEVNNGKIEFYVKPHESYAKVGLMEIIGWSVPFQVYLPNANEWYKIVIAFDENGNALTASAYKEDGSVLDGKESVAMTGCTVSNLYLIVYTQIVDWGTPTFADKGSCEIAVLQTSKKKLEITNVAVLNKYAPSTASQNEDDRVYKYAVEELIGLYSELTGTTLEVNYVNSASELDANKKYFVLGSALAEENGLSQDGLTTDTGYIVKKKSGSVYLYGKTGYGTLNALYGAFSQAFGLEFYTDTVYTYDSGEFGYDKIEDTVFNPSIDYNWASGEMEYIASGEASPNFNYQHRLGYVNSWQIIGGGYHNFFEVLPKETYKAAHPDWYTTATNPGGESFDTLSLAYGLESADNDVMATAVADYVYDYITEQKNNHVEKSMFVFGQPDNWGWSNSSYSQAIKNKYGAYSAEYILFMNKVAKILDEKYTFGRRLQLALLAYNATLETPTYSDDLKFYNGDEVYMGVIFAPIESNLYLRLDSPANGYSEHNESNDGYAEIYGKTNQYYYNQLLSWKRFLNGGELSVFYYSAHYDNYFVPLDSVTNMGQKYKFFADNGVKHIYNLGQAGDDVHTDWYALKTYMGKKYAENASRTDADGLILNFCKAYYGAAGEIMYELYKAEVAQYKVASDYWINQKGADPTGGHLIRGYLFNRNCWGGNSNLLLGWYGKIENALATVESGSEYYNRIKIEGLNIRYLLAGVFGNTTKGSMSDISADAKSLGIDIFAEGSAYTSDGKYGQSGKIEDLK